MSAGAIYQGLVPSPATPNVDWRIVAESFDWFRTLADCPQDAKHHAEGNVQIHTRMVVEALLGETGWARLGDADRRVLFWAALLHDVAKPATTRTESDGRITSPGHSRRGQVMARRILWQLGAPIAERERICHLITHHQQPFFLIQRTAPERRAHLISHETRCDLLAIHAEADIRGRIAHDASRALDNIALFRLLCEEEACLEQPRRFPSDHARFLYFRKSGASPDYEPYDDWDVTVTIASGLPASGKDTWIEANAGGREVISLDGLRSELDIEPTDAQGPVIAAARERARRALRARRPFIWNATNLSRQIRGTVIDLVSDYRAKVELVYVETRPAELARRNAARSAPVPSAAIERMLERWEVPTPVECHALTIVET